VLCITGFIIWLPKKIRGIKSFRPGLKIKFTARWKRINHDLHSTLGFYAGCLLLIMALTGLNWSFEWYKDGMSTVLGAKVFGARDEKPLPSVANGQPLALNVIVEAGNTVFPYNGTTTVTFPKDAEDSFVLRKQQHNTLNKSSYDKVVLDQYSGAILKKE